MEHVFFSFLVGLRIWCRCSWWELRLFFPGLKTLSRTCISTWQLMSISCLYRSETGQIRRKKLGSASFRVGSRDRWVTGIKHIFFLGFVNLIIINVTPIYESFISDLNKNVLVLFHLSVKGLIPMTSPSPSTLTPITPPIVPTFTSWLFRQF